MVSALVAGQLDDAAVGRQRAVQDGQAAAGLMGVSMGLTTTWPGVSTAAAAMSRSVWPVTVGASPSMRSRLSSSRVTSPMPPDWYSS